MTFPAGTLVVPPNYEAAVSGYDAALITARKVILMRAGKRVASAHRRTTFDPNNAAFGAIVQFVRAQNRG